MRLRPILRLLLAGLLAGTALLTPWSGGSHTPPLRVGYQVAHADGPGDWPMLGHDPAHSGYNPDETQLKPPLRLKWSYSMGGYVPPSPRGALYYSSPAVANGVVYVGSTDRTVYALDAATGALRWSYTTGGQVVSSPAVADGVVYVGSEDGKLYALEAATGAFRWSYTTGGGVFSSPAVVNGVVYVGSEGGKVYALDAATGDFKWSYTTTDPTGDPVRSSPAVAKGVVYVGSMGSLAPKVYALDADTGTLKCFSATGYKVWSSPAVAGGVVYVGYMHPDSRFRALDASTGAFKWSYTTRGAVQSSPAVANGVVYVGSDDRKVYARLQPGSPGRRPGVQLAGLRLR